VGVGGVGLGGVGLVVVDVVGVGVDVDVVGVGVGVGSVVAVVDPLLGEMVGLSFVGSGQPARRATRRIGAQAAPMAFMGSTPHRQA